MSDLRNRLIRLAHQKPELREHLLPLLRVKSGGRDIVAMPVGMPRLRGKFPLGRTVVTRGVNNQMAEDPDFAEFVMKSMTRHAHGDWGDLDRQDAKQNDEALKSGEARIMSVYKKGAPGNKTIWIITEWDGSATTVLFPDEY